MERRGQIPRSWRKPGAGVSPPSTRPVSPRLPHSGEARIRGRPTPRSGGDDPGKSLKRELGQEESTPSSSGHWCYRRATAAAPPAGSASRASGGRGDLLSQPTSASLRRWSASGNALGGAVGEQLLAAKLSDGASGHGSSEARRGGRASRSMAPSVRRRAEPDQRAGPRRQTSPRPRQRRRHSLGRPPVFPIRAKPG